MSKYIGNVSAYAYAVSKGYTGTEEEFAALMADYADVGQRAEDAAESALNSKTAAQTAAQTATTKAGEASTSATSASGSASAASASASAAFGSATSAANSATAASGSATAAAGSATTASTKASEAAQSEANTVIAKNAAEAAQTAAEAAQGKAEDAKGEAETTAQSIAASAAQIATNTANITQLQSEVSALPTDGVVANSKQLLSKNGTDNTEPYTFRAVPVNADRAELDAVVGGTVNFNQIVQNGNFESTDGWNRGTVSNNVISFPVSAGEWTTTLSRSHSTIGGHKFLSIADVKTTISDRVRFKYPNLSAQVTLTADVWTTIGAIVSITNNGTTIAVQFLGVTDAVYSVRNYMLFDLTAMFGSTIADYIYQLEQSTAGAGVAWFRKLFPKDYYPYDAGTLKSVEGVSEKVTRDADNNVLGTYPLDSTLTLRGIPKLADGKLYYDGDRYLPDGTVERRYGIVDLGTLSWNNSQYTTDEKKVVYTLVNGLKGGIGANVLANLIAENYKALPSNQVLNTLNTIGAQKNNDVRSYLWCCVAPGSSPSGYCVYELSTPTTETADPYQSLQVCDPNGTEEFATTGIVPVGHETRYPENLRSKIEGLPWDFSSLIAPTEKTATASRNYTTGALLIMGNILYKVTANIANGGTITPNTNVTATTLSEVISALQ